jgi:hypothetical protein
VRPCSEAECHDAPKLIVEAAPGEAAVIDDRIMIGDNGGTIASSDYDPACSKAFELNKHCTRYSVDVHPDWRIT